jgi:hypothetical protein
MSEKINEQDSFEEMVDAGTEAMMAALHGEEEEWLRNAEVREKKHNQKKEPESKKLTTNLGDLLKNAGVVK